MFYDELVEESKDWKAWRAKKLAEKASETEEDEFVGEDDDGEDVEVVHQALNVESPARPPKKGKLRRYSETEGDDSDAQAPYVTSKKRYTTPPPSSQRTAARTSDVVVEVLSPSRQRMEEVQGTPHAASALQAADEMRAASSGSRIPSFILKKTGTSSHSAATTAHIIPDEVTDMVSQADRASSQKQSVSQASYPASNSSRNVLQGVNSEKQARPEGHLIMTLDDSGSEDSAAVVTDDDTAKQSHMRYRPAPHLINNGQPDLEDSFKAEMIAAIPRSPEPVLPHNDTTSMSLENSLEEIQANPSLYQVRTSTPGPKPFEQITEERVKATLALKHKRQHSRESDGPGSPSKLVTTHAPKRSRVEASASNQTPYNPRRRILQSPNLEQEDGVDETTKTTRRLETRSGQVIPVSGSAPRSSRPFTPATNNHFTYISDTEEDPSQVANRGDPQVPPPFPSQPVSQTIREKLPRPPLPL